MVHRECKQELDALGIIRAALDASPDGFALHRAVRDDAGHVTGFVLEMINRAGAAPFTDDPSELIGRNVAELLGPTSAPMVAAFRRCLDTGAIQRFRTTFMGSAAAGTTESVVVRLNDDVLMSTWRDITADLVSQSVVEEALRHRGEAWQELREAFDAMSDAVAVLQAREDGNLDVLFINETGAAALGTSTLDAPGHRLDDLAGDDAGEWLRHLAARALASAHEVSDRAVVTDSTGRILDGRHVTIRAFGDRRLLVVSRDISHELWSAAAQPDTTLT